MDSNQIVIKLKDSRSSQSSFKQLNLPGPSGLLHTQAKSRDHEFVRAQKKVTKGRPKTPPKSCSVVTDPEV